MRLKRRFTVAQVMAAVALAAAALALHRRPEPRLSWKDRRERVDVHMSSGLEALKAGDAAKARLHFEEAVRVDPDCYNGLCNLAMAHAARGDDAESLRRLDEAVAVGQKVGAGARDLARLLRTRAAVSVQSSRRQGSGPEAARLCRRALDDLAAALRLYGTPPPTPDAAFESSFVERGRGEAEQRLGEIEADLGNPGAARAHYAEARRHVLASLTLRQGDPNVLALLREIERHLPDAGTAPRAPSLR